MDFISKILKMDESKDSGISESSIYSVLFDKIGYSIKSGQPEISDNDWLYKTGEIYLELCKRMGYKCTDDIYKPLNDALSKYFKDMDTDDDVATKWERYHNTKFRESKDIYDDDDVATKWERYHNTKFRESK
jgi:hypothetical protein